MATSQKTLVLKLNNGLVKVELLEELAPRHVERVCMLAEEGFYNGCPFHRVIEGFMAQTGDGSKKDGTGGSTYPNLQHEFSDKPHMRGTVSMARAQDVHSANSQFFICFDDTPHLNGQYTVFGTVKDGMEHIDSIKRGSGHSGMVTNPDTIIEAYVEAGGEA